MSHRVLMLGGKRAGKSSLLASIYYTLTHDSSLSCNCEDKTSFQSDILEKKRQEVERYIYRFRIISGDKKQKPLFLVDADETVERGVYKLRITTGDAYLDLDFIDVPGEWMTSNSMGHADLLDEIRRTDVFLIAIDTPMLMEAPDYISRKYNRVNAIQSVLDNGELLKVGGDKKLIVFCPIKCEKWIQHGQTSEVVNRIRTAYANIINTWLVPGIEMVIIPVQTAGGIEFVKQLPGKMMQRNQFPREELCSVDETSRRYLMPDGFFLDFHSSIMVREDPVRNEYPLSWFQVNSNGYSPKACEDVTLSIIRFLVNKEIEYCSQRMKEKKWWQVWKPPFGKYLDSFQRFIQKNTNERESEILINDYVK